MGGRWGSEAMAMATCAAPPQAPPPPRPEQCAPRPLGSRFWALAEDSSDDECVPPSPPPSASPAHRPSEFMVGDFICTALLSPVASRSGRGRRQADPSCSVADVFFVCTANYAVMGGIGCVLVSCIMTSSCHLHGYRSVVELEG
jgi:hypothetical protein